MSATKMIALSILGLGLLAETSAQSLSTEEQQYLEALEAELPGTLMNNPIEISLQTFGENYSAKVVSADIPGEAAYRVRVKSAHRNPWDISVSGDLTAGVEQGTSVLVAFWARADKPNKQTGKGHIQLRVQQEAAPYAGVVESLLEVSDEWQMYEISGTANQSYSADEISIAFNIGDHRQTIEFGPFYVLDLGVQPN